MTFPGLTGQILKSDLMISYVLKVNNMDSLVAAQFLNRAPILFNLDSPVAALTVFNYVSDQVT